MSDATTLQFIGLLIQSQYLGKDGVGLSKEIHFESFYETTRRPLYGYLFRIVGETTLAQDLFQETYLRFLNAKVASMDAAAQRAYLFRIAANLVNDHYRKRKRELEGETELMKTTGEPMPVPMDTRPIDSALAQLPAQSRSLLWLAYVEQFDHVRIAEMLGIQSGSVRVLLFRAKQKMLSLLGGKVDKAGRS